MIVRLSFLHKKYSTLTIWPFIFVKENFYKKDKILINHEKIHLRQQVELLWAPFFLWYITEFIIKLIIYKNWNLAYKSISFEREAYKNEGNKEYLQDRKFWSFWKYLYNTNRN